MAYINPFIKVNAGGIPRLSAINIPTVEADNSLTYDTYPLSIIHTDKQIITVCLKNSKILTDFANKKVILSVS